MSQEHRILIDYTNHAGVRQVREIEPVEPAGLVYDSSKWHPEPQWLVHAFDHGKQAMRTFAVKDIHRWGIEPGRQMDIDLSIAAQLQRSMEMNASIRNEYGGKLRPGDGSVPALQARADGDAESCKQFADRMRDIVTALDHGLGQRAKEIAELALKMPWVSE